MGSDELIFRSEKLFRGALLSRKPFLFSQKSISNTQQFSQRSNLFYCTSKNLFSINTLYDSFQVMNLSNHAMPAVNRLCKDFLKTLLVVDRSDRVSSSATKQTNGLQKLDEEPSKTDSTLANDDSDDEKTDSSDVTRMLKIKQVDKALMANAGADAVETDFFQMEKSLKKLATKDFKFNL
jgi:hypothetical protein